jgi:hypothetical protein
MPDATKPPIHLLVFSAALQQRLEQTITCFLDLVEAAACYPLIKKQWVEFLGERPDPLIDRVETTPSLG